MINLNDFMNIMGYALIILLVGIITVIVIGGLTRMAPKKPVPAKKELIKSPKYEFAEEIFHKPHIEPAPESPRDNYEIPWGYGDNKITAMARDPYWVHVYWEISEEKKAYLRQMYGDTALNESTPILRVYDITGVLFNGFNANNYFDITINDFANSWYIHVGGPDRTYCIDLGRILKNGTFVIIARSNYVIMPRDSISMKSDPLWMMVDEKERKLYDLIRSGYGLSSPALIGKGEYGISSEILFKK